MPTSCVQEVDVLVVGAGISGLQAAVNVQKAGLSCLVLEATDRIGGKILSVPNLRGSSETVDLGAAWINDTSQSHIYALAKRYKIEFQEQQIGDVIYELDGGSRIKLPPDEMPLPPNDDPAFIQLVINIDQVGEEVEKEHFAGRMSEELDKLTFKQWCQTVSTGSDNILVFMDFLSNAILGADANDFSALYMLRYIRAATGFQNIIGGTKDGGQYLRPFTGSIGYVHGLANELKSNTVHLNSPVTAIHQHKDYCAVRSSSGSGHRAKKVIVSVPTPLYHHIRFMPELPQTKRRLGESTKLGYYSKVILVYSSPWWRQNNMCGQMSSLIGPVRMTYDTSIDARKQYSLSLFMVGPTGRKWSELSDLKRKRAAVDHVERVFSGFVDDGEVPQPINVIEYEWSKQAWFEGAPSPVYPPRLLTSPAGKALIEPIGHIHFIGTETGDVWEGYMEGAVRSGERGSIEVIEALNGLVMTNPGNQQ